MYDSSDLLVVALGTSHADEKPLTAIQCVPVWFLGNGWTVCVDGELADADECGEQCRVREDITREVRTEA